MSFSFAVSVPKPALDDFKEISIRKNGINQLALPSIIKLMLPRFVCWCSHWLERKPQYDF